MNRNVISVIVFVVAAAVVLGILQFIVHLQGAPIKVAISVVVALIAAGITFAVVKNPTASST